MGSLNHGHVMHSRLALFVCATYASFCDALVIGATPRSHLAHSTCVRMLFGGGKEGGGGGLNMMETIKKAQEVGVKVKALQEELTATEIEATAADGCDSHNIRCPGPFECHSHRRVARERRQRSLGGSEPGH